MRRYEDITLISGAATSGTLIERKMRSSLWAQVTEGVKLAAILCGFGKI